MKSVVIDIGSMLIKAGPANPDVPPMIIDKSSFAEDVLVHPVVRGRVVNWEGMDELLIQVLYYRLGWKVGEEGNVFFTEPLFTPKADKERMIALLFESFNVPGFYMCEEAQLSVWASGYSSGCTVDIGDGKIDIATVIEGSVQEIASRRFEIGGFDLTKLLAQELDISNPLVNLSLSDVEKLKERYACCTSNARVYKATQETCPVDKYILPDGKEILIGKERFTIGEALFQPSILGVEGCGICEQLVRIVSALPSENHRELLENIILCGGTVSMTGFDFRFQTEVNLYSPEIHPVVLKTPVDMPENWYTYSAWMGGAIYAQQLFKDGVHITKAEYEEKGPACVHRKVQL